MKKLLNILTVCVLMALIPVTSNAQEPLMSPKHDGVSIGNVKVSREGTDLVVDYQIMLGDNVLSCSVEVVMFVGGTGGQKYVLNSSELKGDFGKITQSGFKQVRYSVENRKAQIAGRDIRFTLNVRNKDVMDGKIVTMFSTSVVPQFSCGVMLGYVKKFGGYVKIRTNFRSSQSAYQVDKSGRIDGGGIIWTNGTQRKTRLQATGGALFRLNRWLYPYAGLGYGSRDVLWQDYREDWARVTDYSCKGVAAEVGAIAKIGPVAFSAGVSTTSFKYTEFELGVGVIF